MVSKFVRLWFLCLPVPFLCGLGPKKTAFIRERRPISRGCIRSPDPVAFACGAVESSNCMMVWIVKGKTWYSKR